MLTAFREDLLLPALGFLRERGATATASLRVPGTAGESANFASATAPAALNHHATGLETRRTGGSSRSLFATATGVLPQRAASAGSEPMKVSVIDHTKNTVSKTRPGVSKTNVAPSYKESLPPVVTVATSFDVPRPGKPEELALHPQDGEGPVVRQPTSSSAAPTTSRATTRMQPQDVAEMILAEKKALYRPLMERIERAERMLEAATKPCLQQMNPSPQTAAFYCPQRVRPSIKMGQYLLRLVKGLNKVHRDGRAPHETIGCQAMLQALVYVERLMTTVPGFVLDELNVHRVVALAMLVSVKTLEDDVIANTSFAQLAGVPVSELNQLEASFCTVLGWNLHVSREEFDYFLCCFK